MTDVVGQVGSVDSAGVIGQPGQVSRADVHADFLSAVLSPDGQDALVDEVKRRIALGDSADVLLADLSGLRPFVAEQTEDGILDVMDRLVGWCQPSARLDG